MSFLNGIPFAHAWTGALEGGHRCMKGCHHTKLNNIKGLAKQGQEKVQQPLTAAAARARKPPRWVYIHRAWVCGPALIDVRRRFVREEPKGFGFMISGLGFTGYTEGLGVPTWDAPASCGSSHPQPPEGRPLPQHPRYQ
jgi:hypothetical protein